VKTALIAIPVLLVLLAVFVRFLEPHFAFFPEAGESVTPRDFGLAYEPLTIETRDGERLQAWVLQSGAPRARVVYFHGNGGNLSVWAPILVNVARHGYSVTAFDYRGYGLSTGRPSERGLYRDVDAIVEGVRDDRDRPVPLLYWGRSLGAAAAAYAATVRRPDGLILESGFPDARSLVRSSLPLALLSLFSTYRFTSPVLVLHGDGDTIIPFELGRRLYEEIRGPKHFVTIRGGDHNDATPPDPAAYWEAIDRFITSL
jgi:fermentation-respiration switch protein FrsA (DUF1100 family)